jgi:N,N'-diacetylchitobiose transport system permease protein
MSNTSLKVRGARFSIWPYLLVAPAVLVVGAILGYPIFRLFELAFQKYGIEEIIFGAAQYIGFENFATIFADEEFWQVLSRTIAFTVYAVTVSVVLGAILAHALLRMSKPLQIVVNSVMVIVWAMPQLVGISIWRWMFSYDFSVITGTIQNLGFDISNVNWFENPVIGFGIIGLVVIWGAIPFITISLYAGLTQVPKEFVEAAELDGASRYQVFRNIYLPLLLPIYVILISLSIIWDFQVFAHIWVMLEFRPDPEYYTMAVYAFQTSFGISEYGRGSAIAVVMVFILLAATLYYLRQMIKESK